MQSKFLMCLVFICICANASTQTFDPTDASVGSHFVCEDGLFSKGNSSQRANEWTDKKTIRKLKHVDNEVPPEITRIKNGVVFVSAGIAPGIGIFTQNWYAYDDERHIFVSVEGKSYESMRPRPDLPVHKNQMDRYVRNGKRLHRAERITILAANPKTVNSLSCIAERHISLRDSKGVTAGGNMPSADGWAYVNVLKNGILIKKNSNDERVRKSQDDLMHFLYATFHPTN